MTPTRILLASTLAICLPLITLAEGNSHGNGHGRANGNGHGNANGHATVIFEDGTTARCPPGLANRSPACVPPGQASRGVTTLERVDYPRIQLGVPLDPNNFVYIDDPTYYDLPPTPDGMRYAEIDGTIVLIDAVSYELLQLIRNAAAVIN